MKFDERPRSNRLIPKFDETPRAMVIKRSKSKSNAKCPMLRPEPSKNLQIRPNASSFAGVELAEPIDFNILGKLLSQRHFKKYLNPLML